ncbi:MAG: hypothetical protein PHZ25_01360, partial [Candidatus Pacebacteria bacterium]|nr:hypothetical protein [Candidatus Paceibacterota bacterium]
MEKGNIADVALEFIFIKIIMENIFYIFRAINLFFSKTAKSAAKNKPLAMAFVALLASGFFI